jgi:TRAP-type C4-dicarboxylate transport system substrate-binding protein
MNINYRLPLLGMALAGVMPLTAQAQIELKVSSFVPQNDALMHIIEVWASEITDRSDGEITFAYFPSSQMGPPDRQYDLARTGVADIALTIHGFTPGRFPMTEVAYLPGLFEGVPSDRSAAILWSMYERYLAAEHEGTRVLAITPTSQAFILSQRPYPDLASLAGQRIRSAGAAMSDTLQALGAVPVAVPSPEMADALQRGLVDGLGVTYQSAADWQIENIGTDVWGVSIGVVTFTLVMNEERYQSLSPEHQALIDETTGEVMSIAFGTHIDEAEVDAIERIAGNFTVTNPDAENLAEIEAVLAERIETGLQTLEDQGLPARALYADIQAAVATAVAGD